MRDAPVRLRLYRPDDLAGRLICWRLESCWSHATIEIGGTIFSATAPRVVGVAPNDPAFGMPPRTGEALDVDLSDTEAARAWAYCRSMVGTGYDVRSILAWALRIRALQDGRRVYCFDYVRDALVAAGVFPVSKRLITGDQLLVDLCAAGRIQPPPAGTAVRAAMQRAPIINA